MTDLDDIAAGEYLLADSLPVNVYPVAAVQIPDHAYTGLSCDRRMTPGGTVVFENNARIRSAAHDHFVRVELKYVCSAEGVLDEQS